MKKIAIAIPVFMLLSFDCLQAQTIYESCGDVTYGNNSGQSTDNSMSSDGGSTCNLNPYDITFVAGDELVINPGHDLVLEGFWTIAVVVTVDNSGGMYYDGGKMDLPAGSGLILRLGSNLACGTEGSEDPCASNDQLRIGAETYSAGELDVIDAADKPSFTDDSGNTVQLPIVLGFFNTISKAKTVDLNWQTISEENFDFFSIERSDDGEHFYEIGTVPGHGNSNDPIDYSFVDASPLFGMSYYRLNAIDYDGSYEKFQILAVEFIPDDLQVSIYPNPGNGNNMRLRLGLPTEAKLKTVSVYNLSGEQIFERTLTVGQNKLNLKSQLGKGLYFAKIQIDNYTTTRKLIIN